MPSSIIKVPVFPNQYLLFFQLYLSCSRKHFAIYYDSDVRMGFFDIQGISVTMERNLERLFHLQHISIGYVFSEIVADKETAGDAEKGREKKNDFIHIQVMISDFLRQDRYSP